MQLDRISYQYPDGSTAAYDFHPRLTIIDVHPAHRSALVEHLLSALASQSPGVHVEFTRADGNGFVAFRPYGAAHRVIDLEQGTDVTALYDGADGIDVLRPLGVEPATAHSTLLATNRDLALIDPTEGWMSHLLTHDTERLLSAADDAVAAERALREATVAMRTSPEAATVVSTAYARRDSATDLEKRHNRIRVATLVIGTACPVAAVVGLNTIGGGPAMALIAGAVALAGGCLVYERKLARAVDAEYDALAAAGTDSYHELEAQIDGSPLSSPEHRNYLVDVAERFRTSTALWQEMAGDIPATWVLAHRDRLREMAAMRAAMQPVPVDTTPDGGSCGAAVLAGLMGRAQAIHELCDQEALPLFLDDPLAGMDWAEKVPVLEFLNRLSEHQQMVLCTDDLEILGWARLEAMAGNAAVLDVNPGRSMATAESASNG